jgi:crotonobetainyl-CoA:carnitine CoA-transferase CaiB-like acyl-CoA transferase
MTALQPGVAGPLAGMRVVDFGRVIAAPLTAQVLADLGAAVIKIERPGVGDESRSYTTSEDLDAPLFLGLNRNKRSVAIDIASPAGYEVVRRLAERADVVLHNFRPGVMDRLGYGPAQVHEWNPAIVYCAISGFGQTGPLSTKAANDVLAQAYSGLMSFTGAEGGPPVRCPVQIADFTAGLYAAIGILAALNERAVTGIGRVIETSLIEGMLTLESMQLIDYLGTGRLPQRLASGNALGQPNQAFPTADGEVLIAAVNDGMWARCAHALGGSELAEDSRFVRAFDRLRHRDALAAELESITSRLTTAECMRRLDDAGVVCSPINTIATIAADEQVAHLGILQQIDRPDGDPVTVVGSPLTIDGERRGAHLAPPRRGADTASVLAELGFDPMEISRLADAGVAEVVRSDGESAERRSTDRAR